MADLFVNTAVTTGLSRKRIIWVAGIIIIILLIAVFWGIPRSGDNSHSLNTLTNSIENTSLNNTRTSASILAVVAQLQDKAHESSVLVPDSGINTHNLAVASNITESKLQGHSHEIVDVPPIVRIDQNSFNKSLSQAKEQYALQQVNNSYSSNSAKSLLFSNIASDSKSSENIVRSNASAASVAAGDDVAATHPNFNIMSNDTLNSKVIQSTSPYELKAGSIIPAIMINGINSDLPGEIIAEVRENVYDSATRRYLLIPQGARLVGLYDSRIIYGQERILVAWNRLIYQDGSSINLKAMPGTDLSGYAGFHDLVDNKYWKIFGSSFIMGVITAGMQYSQNNTDTYTSGGPGFYEPTVGQTLAGGLGQQLGQTGLEVTEKNLNVQPTLIIRPNYPFNVMLTADVVFSSYTHRL